MAVAWVFLTLPYGMGTSKKPLNLPKLEEGVEELMKVCHGFMFSRINCGLHPNETVEGAGNDAKVIGECFQSEWKNRTMKAEFECGYSETGNISVDVRILLSPNTIK